MKINIKRFIFRVNLTDTNTIFFFSIITAMQFILAVSRRTHKVNDIHNVSKVSVKNELAS